MIKDRERFFNFLVLQLTGNFTKGNEKGKGRKEERRKRETEKRERGESYDVEEREGAQKGWRNHEEYHERKKRKIKKSERLSGERKKIRKKKKNEKE